MVSKRTAFIYILGCVYCFAVREEVEESIEEMAEMNADSETLPETNLTEIVGGETKHVRKLMALRTDPKTSCHYAALPDLGFGSYSCNPTTQFKQNSECSYRCFGSTEFIPVKCQCLENRGIFWHPHPDGCHWLFNHAEHCEFVETFIPQVQLSSRAAVIGSPVDENIQDMISDMHEEAARLQEANEKVLTELRHVEFENSFSSAMMIQNMKSFQDRQTQSNLKFMKDMEDRLRVYEHQQKLPIQHMEKEVLELRHEIKDTRRLPMNQVVDLPALEEYIRSEVVKAILQLTPSNNQENSQ